MVKKMLQKFQSTGTHFFSFIIHHGKYFPLSSQFCPASLCLTRFLIPFYYYFFITSASLESPHLNRGLCWTTLPSLKPCGSERYFTKVLYKLIQATGPCLEICKLQDKSELDPSCCWLCSSSPCPDHASLCFWLWNSLFSSFLLCCQVQSFQNTSSSWLWKPLGRGRLSHASSHMGQLRSMEEQLLVHNQLGDHQQSWGK